MTNEEKRAALAATLAPDTDTEEVLDNVLDDAEALVLNRMFPFGYPDGTVVPTRYERIQIQLAAELYSKRGAEGQISHSENGISRTWLEESALLKRVIPHVGSVVTSNA
jgi:hypothetical protein